METGSKHWLYGSRKELTSPVEDNIDKHITKVGTNTLPRCVWVWGKHNGKLLTDLKQFSKSFISPPTASGTRSKDT